MSRNRLRKKLGVWMISGTMTFKQTVIITSTTNGVRGRTPPKRKFLQINAKFIERFLALENRLADNGTPMGEATLDEMEAVWQALKKDRG